MARDNAPLYALLYRAQLAEKDWPLSRAAEETGVDLAVLYRVVNAEREPTTETRNRLDGGLASGSVPDYTARPIYLLGLVGPEGARALLADEQGRPGAFARRDLADAAAGLLRQLGFEGAVPVPAWPEFLAERLGAGSAEGMPEPFSNGEYVLDLGPVEDIPGRVTGFIVSLAHTAQAPSEESSRV